MIKLTRLSTSVLVALVFAFAAPACSSAAAVGQGAAVVLRLVSDALLWLQGIDVVAQEWFRRHPDVPVDVRSRYVQLYDTAVASLRAAQSAAEGTEHLTDEQIGEAFEDFEQAYRQLKDLLEAHQLMDAEGQLLLDGVQVGKLAAPPRAITR